MEGLRLAFVGYLLVMVAVIPSVRATSADDLVVGYRALGSSSLTREAYQVELLRWTAIAELVNASIESGRLGEWSSALSGLQHAASIFDRNADTNQELAQSVDAFVILAGTTPFSRPAEASTWHEIQGEALDQVVADALQIFSHRASSKEGIAALELGVTAQRTLAPSVPAPLAPLLAAEQALLKADLDHAQALSNQATRLATLVTSPWNPLRLPLLETAQDQLQTAHTIYARHGATNETAAVDAQAAQVSGKIDTTGVPWTTVVVLTSGTVLAATLFVQWRLSGWDTDYEKARRASFLMGVPK